MFGDKFESLVGGQFLEFALGGAAEGALFGSFIAFVNITAYGADKFLFHFFTLLFWFVAHKDNH